MLDAALSNAKRVLKFRIRILKQTGEVETAKRLEEALEALPNQKKRRKQTGYARGSCS